MKFSLRSLILGVLLIGCVASFVMRYRVWQCEYVLLGHRGGIRTLDFNQDGSVLVSGGEDGMVCLWDTRIGRLIKTLFKSDGRIISVELNPRGDLITATYVNGTVNIWKISTGVLLSESFFAHAKKGFGYLSKNGLRCLVALDDGTLAILGGPGDPVTLNAHTTEVGYALVSDDGRFALTVDNMGNAHIWNLEKNTLEPQLENEFRGTVKEVSLLQPFFILAREQMKMRSQQYTRTYDEKITYSMNNPDSTVMELMDNDYKSVGSLMGHREPIYCHAFSPVELLIATGSKDGEVRLWSKQRGEGIPGLIQMVESWLLVFFSVALKISLAKDRRWANLIHKHK